MPVDSLHCASHRRQSESGEAARRVSHVEFARKATDGDVRGGASTVWTDTASRVDGDAGNARYVTMWNDVYGLLALSNAVLQEPFSTSKKSGMWHRTFSLFACVCNCARIQMWSIDFLACHELPVVTTTFTNSSEAEV